MSTKYTKENLIEIKGCKSIREALIKINLSPETKNKNLRDLIKNILTEEGTYLGQSHYRNIKYFKKNNEEFFCNNCSKRTTYSVREALFDRNIKKKECECCGLSMWNEKPIPLEVHHKDGDKYNNKLENLEILCPNCHYFTDTYKTKNRKAGVS